MVKYRVASTVLLFLVILACAFALDVTDVTPTQNTNSDFAKINSTMQTEFVKLNQKIDLLESKAQMQTDLQAHLNVVNDIISNFKSQMIIGLIITQLATIGLAFGIFFYFKAQRRI